MNDSGEERRPTMREREKLRVASEERNIPRRRREKQCMRVYCWRVGRKLVITREEMRCGRRALRMAKRMKTGVCIYYGG